MKRLGARLRVVGLVCGLAGGLPGALAAADPETLARLAADGRVGAETVAALSEGKPVRVMVAFGLEAGRARRPVLAGDGAEYRDAIARVADELLFRVPQGDFQLLRRFRSVRAFAGTITAEGAAALLEDPRVLRIDLDAGGTGHLGEAVPLSQLDDLQTMGLTGEGITVAVLDSGLDTDHADLGDDLVAERCFCDDNSPGPAGCCPGGKDDESGPGSAEDDHGHGTNVTGIVTSNGTTPAPVGGALDAGIVAIKVLDFNNSFCCTSDIVKALDWILAERPDVDVVNMSLGTFMLYPGNCDNADAFTMAMADAVDALHAAGVPSFVSSGNSGSGTAMPSPACIANSISVGAVWDSNVGMQTVFCTETTTAADKVTCFSNSNSTTDLFAPGAPTTSTGLSNGTSTFYGTSQAAPLCAACAALLLESYPDLTPDEIEALLESSSTMVTDATNGLSFPRLDCLEAHTPCGDPLTWDLDQATPVTGVEDLTACLEIRAGQYPIAGTGMVTHTAGERIAYRNDFTVDADGEYTAALEPALAVLP